MEKELCLCSCILILFLAKTTCQASWVLQCSHFRILRCRVWGCVQNVSFLSANCLCKYVLANIFGSLYFAMV